MLDSKIVGSSTVETMVDFPIWERELTRLIRISSFTNSYRLIITVSSFTRRNADEDVAYNPVIFEAGVLFAIYQICSIFLPWSGALAFRSEFMPVTASSLVFFGGCVLAVSLARPARASSGVLALRTAGILGPAIATAIILAVALVPVKTLVPISGEQHVLNSRIYTGE